MSRFRASGAHFLISAFVACVLLSLCWFIWYPAPLLGLVFFVWYPIPLHTAVGVT